MKRYILPLMVIAALMIFLEDATTLIIYLSPLILMMLLPKRKSKGRKRAIHAPSDLNEMDGIEFEHYVAQIFERLGYEAEVTKESGDFGADILLTREHERICVQCKRYKSLVGLSSVQEVLGSLRYYNAARGIVVTNSSFTDAAKELAKVNNIELIDGARLEKLIKSGKKW